MQDPLRIVFIEHRQENHGIAAQLLSDCHLDFSWQDAASPRELSKVAENFKPHIVFCTDEASTNSSHGILEVLRLLCSQTPKILVSSVCDVSSAVMPQTAAPVPNATTQVAQNAADLRKGFAGVLDSSAAPAVVSDSEGWIIYANKRACRLLESFSRSLVTVLSAATDQCPPMPHWLPASHDVKPYVEMDKTAFDSATSQRCQHRLAHSDSWSLLPTLLHIEDLIGCLTAPRDDRRAAPAVIALDRNSGRIPDETDNHALSGAAISVEPSDMPAEPARHGWIVRISPDDFLVVLPDPAQPADAADTVQRLLDSIARSHLFVRSVDQAPDINETDATTARECDVGHRRALSVHAPASAHRSDCLPMDAPLSDDVQCQSLSVQFQPQFDIRTGRGCGVEALARWMLRSGENIAPSVFIPAAERSGLIHSLGAWMLRSACETAYPWCSRDAQRTTLSVNVSPVQIDGQFSAVLGRILEQIHFPANQLELEISENALIANPEVMIEYLKQWKELGVRIAIDDFGTGGSSLSYLSRLPVDRLKLDQSLVYRITSDKKAASVTRSIVALVAQLGIDVIAEGVETEPQLQMLTDLECPMAQGYLLGRPMPARQAHLALRRVWGNRFAPMRPAEVPHA